MPRNLARSPSVSRRERFALALAIAVSVPSSLLLGGLVSLPSLVEHGIEWLLPGHSHTAARGLHADSARSTPMSIGKTGAAAVNVLALPSREARRARHGVAGATRAARRSGASHEGSGSLGSKAPAATGGAAIGNPGSAGSNDSASTSPSDGAGTEAPGLPTVTGGSQGAVASARVAVHGTHVTASASVSAANSTMTADADPASGSAGAGVAIATPVGEVAASADVAAPAASATVATPVASATVGASAVSPPAVPLPLAIAP